MRALLEQIAHPFFATFALLFFICAFIGVVYWTFKSIKPSEVEPRAHIPLHEGSVAKERTSHE